MKVNEIFYSLQGEGFFTGTPAVFLRLSGCNLRCPFCDTAHETFTEMSVAEIVEAVSQYPARHIVITGGEPSLRITPELIDALHAVNFFIQIETNGTRPIPSGIDWITCSPKNADVVLTRVDELKIVYTGPESEDSIPTLASRIEAAHRFVQPCDTGVAARNSSILASCISFLKQHPAWRLSLQTHKLINIP